MIETSVLRMLQILPITADCQLAEVNIERESLEKVLDNKEKFVKEHLLIGTAKIAAGIDF